MQKMSFKNIVETKLHMTISIFYYYKSSLIFYNNNKIFSNIIIKK